MPRVASKAQKRNKGKRPTLVFRPLTPSLVDDLGKVQHGGWGRSCWCMYPRLTDAQTRELPGPGSENERRREAMKKLARRRRKPGLLAYEDGEPVGWIAVAPRNELARVDRSRATPRVDDEDVWVIPCVTVKRAARGRGIALGLIRAAVDYAAELGAPSVEAYPRADAARVKDDNAYFGTEPLFRRAGFKVIRKPPKDLPSNWVRRVTMRVKT